MERLRLWWQSLSPERKRIAVAMGGAGVIGLVLAISLLGRQEAWVTLYTHLSPDDLTAASVELSRVGVPFRTRSEEGALLVPSEKVAVARMALAQAGLPKTGAFQVKGFELLDQASLTTSDFLQRTNYWRALQGELARSITTLDPIANARVHLNLPQPTVFEERRKEPSASVVVALKPGRSLSKEQAQAIVFLVSKAVEGLKPENIVVVDTQGNLVWSKGTSENELTGAGEFLSLRWQAEQQMQHRLQELLDRTLGAGKASVQVSVELATDARKTESELYLPAEGGNQGIPATHSETQETYQSQGAPVTAGAAGAATNLQLTPPLPVTLLGGNYTKSERKTEYRVSRRVERIEQLPGAIRRVSVAVLVRGELTPAEQAALRQAIGAAVGLDAARGDTVVVVPVRMERPVSTPRLGRGRPQPTPKIFWGWLAAIPVGLLLSVSLFVAWRRRRRGVPPTLPSEPTPPEALPRPEVPETSPLEQLRQVARESPQRIAEVVRSWLAEDAVSQRTDGGR
jgi:flagellar M-ring protein FliF